MEVAVTKRRTNESFIEVLFYWIGVICAFVCLALVLSGNTDAIWRFEHTGVPLSWTMGVLSVGAFLAAEFLPSDRVEPNPAFEMVQQEP
jgi:hypothetical protein